MKFEKLFNEILNKKILIYFILLVGIFLRLIYLNQLDDYYDDWNFFFTVDPNISNEITWVRYFGDRKILFEYNSYDWNKVGEDFPYYFAFFSKFVLNFIGYSIEKVHYFILFFSIFSLFLVTKICEIFTPDLKFKVLTLFLFATNLYLIKDLNALRPHSLSIFLTLISLYYFILIFFKNKTSYKNITIFCAITLIYLLIWPLNLAFFIGQFFLLFLKFFSQPIKENKIFIISFSIIVSLYLILNFSYLEYQVINKTEHYTPLNIKFFFSYFFNMFFGSILFGGVMLIIFSYFLIHQIINYIKIYKFKVLLSFNKKTEDIFLIIILSIYFLVISYSIIRAPVMAAKYVPFLLPIIIFWISYKIYVYKKRPIYYIVIFLSILNLAFFWNNIQVDRPPIKKVLKEIESSKTKKVFTTESDVFNHYLKYYNTSIKNNLEFHKFSNFKFDELPKKFWFLCLNNPRFRIGENNLPDEKKCSTFKNYKGLYLIKTVRMPDVLFHHLEKK